MQIWRIVQSSSRKLSGLKDFLEIWNLKLQPHLYRWTDYIDTVHDEGVSFALLKAASHKSSKCVLNTSHKNSYVDFHMLQKPFSVDATKYTQQQDNSQMVSFYNFQKLCDSIRSESSYKDKSKLVKEYLTNVSKLDLYIWICLLLPGVQRKVYNLRDKQLVKIFSKIFHTSQLDMMKHLKNGDVAETIAVFYCKSDACKPNKSSSLLLRDVYDNLGRLSKETKEKEQEDLLTEIIERCTVDDVKYLVRLIKCDLKINAGAKIILDGFHEDSYKTYQANPNLPEIVAQFSKRESDVTKTAMTPISPMLAETCRSLEKSITKFSSGMYVDVKYDGERVQLHKDGAILKYYSRSLKPVLQHKVESLNKYMEKAFPQGANFILDTELVLLDEKTGIPLPFGTLGIHKKSSVEDSSSCLFVFDCLKFNSENLISRPLAKRRAILKREMIEIPNKLQLSETTIVKDIETLQKTVKDIFKRGLEGAVLKDLQGKYEPAKRRWLKVKKGFVTGPMADTVDLVVLGAYYGTGSKGSMMSSFLLGTYDPKTEKWYTVTKASTGLTVNILHQIQHELKVVNIYKDESRVPSWLIIKKNVLPDFVVKDPKNSAVWEIIGDGFTDSSTHTAGGISVRFPRISRIRSDKDWTQATTLQHLQALHKTSREHQ